MIIDNFEGRFGWVITEASYVQKEADLKIVFVLRGLKWNFLWIQSGIHFFAKTRTEKWTWKWKYWKSWSHNNEDFLFVCFLS